MISVVCGIIYKERKLLICRRKPDKSLGGYWEFPGGKIEFGESPESALYRELLEELDMTVDVIEHFKTILHVSPAGSIELKAYSCELVSANYSMTDHDAYEWIHPSKIFDWKLAPADIEIAKSLCS